MINGHEISDYGYYGKTGKFLASDLPVEKDLNGNIPFIYCNYSDIAGARDTTYQLRTKGTSTTGSCDIEQEIEEWNVKIMIEKAKYYE